MDKYSKLIPDESERKEHMKTVQELLCEAITTRHLVQFDYFGNDAHGTRVVEPHMIAYTDDENLALSAWFLRGVSQSEEGEGWRTYLLEDIVNVVILPEQFLGPRPEYKPDGGQRFHNVQCG